MADQSNRSESTLWRLQGKRAELNTPQLTAAVDLAAPGRGITELMLGGTRLEGYVLGVIPGDHFSGADQDIGDIFVRGDDLVVTYVETKTRPYSVQVYWRATADESGVLLLDTILSLQTDLLESFPSVSVETKLPADAIWKLPSDDEPSASLDLSADRPHAWSAADAACFLVRQQSSNWSYAETTHRDDHGDGWVKRTKSDGVQSHRQLGGNFLEKGVIRRLRVRGVFLPRKNDLDVAARSLASLASELPPLTV